MLKQGKEIEVLSATSVFGKHIAEIKMTSTGERVSVIITTNNRRLNT